MTKKKPIPSIYRSFPFHQVRPLKLDGVALPPTVCAAVALPAPLALAAPTRGALGTPSALATERMPLMAASVHGRSLLLSGLGDWRADPWQSADPSRPGREHGDEVHDGFVFVRLSNSM